MLGRLPLRYRLAIWITGLMSCAGVGAWITFVTPVSLVWSAGALVGASLGVLVVAAYLAVLEGGTRSPADPTS